MNAPDAASYQSLPPLERAHYFHRLIVEGTPASQIARTIGKSLAYVSNTLRLLKLPIMVQEGLASNTITEGHARALVGIKDEEQALSIYREILVSNATVRRAEELVRNVMTVKPA